MAVSSEDLLKIKILLPCIEEQERICKLISTLDDKITIEKQILEDWKDFKKAIIQQMFV